MTIQISFYRKNDNFYYLFVLRVRSTDFFVLKFEYYNVKAMAIQYHVSIFSIPNYSYGNREQTFF